MKMVNLKSISIFALILCSLSAMADFKQNYVRYFAFSDIGMTLKKDFRGTKYLEDVPCLKSSETTGSAFAYGSPGTGKPVSDKPNFGFVNSYMQCLRELLELSLPKKILYPAESAFSGYEYYSSIPKEDLDGVIRFQIQRLIGPEKVLLSYDHIGSETEMVVIKRS
jgi:hypothetical protein